MTGAVRTRRVIWVSSYLGIRKFHYSPLLFAAILRCGAANDPDLWILLHDGYYNYRTDKEVKPRHFHPNRDRRKVLLLHGG